MLVYFDRKEETGLKPVELSAGVNVFQSPLSTKTIITIQRRKFGPRGGIVHHESINLSQSEWTEIANKINAKLNGEST